MAIAVDILWEKINCSVDSHIHDNPVVDFKNNNFKTQYCCLMPRKL